MSQVFGYLIGGIKKAIMKREAGEVVIEWDEDSIYQNLTSLIFDYLFSLGITRVVVLAFLYFMSAILYLLIDFWTGYFSTSRKDGELDIALYASVYIALTFFASLFGLVRDNLFIRMILGNSRAIHDEVLEVFLRMSIPWFQRHPTCEIDYKLSYDLRLLDNDLNDRLRKVFEATSFLVGGLLLLNYIYFGLMVIFNIIFLLIICYIGSTFLRTIKYFIRFIADTSTKV